MKFRNLLLIVTMAIFPSSAFADVPSIRDMVKLADFTNAVISPEGSYVALAAPSGEQTGLAVLDIRNYPKLKLVSAYKLSPNEHVYRIYWANDDRVMFTTSMQFGTLNMPRLTGRLYAMDANGDNRMGLYGTGRKDFVFNYFEIIDMMHDDPDWIMIASYAGDRPRPIAFKLNVNDGRLDRDISSPLENGSLHADSQGNIRFAAGTTDELEREIAWRETADSDWK